MFLSIVIPVYNTEKYLDECLLSILGQDIPGDTYEVICVNDGSTDRSLEILRRYEKDYPNVTVIDRPNGGVCEARNAGLLAARGEYIWYVDSDDMLRENCLPELGASLGQTKCDRLVVGSSNCTEDGKRIPAEKGYTPWENSVVWRNIFHRAFLLERNLMFHYPELTFGEDALYIYEIRRHLPACSEWKEQVYIHRNRPGSLSTETSAEIQDRRLRSTIREAEIMKAYCEQDDVPETETANRFMSFWLGCLYAIAQMPRKTAKIYLWELKKVGLYPCRKPKACTTDHCPDITRTDIVGKVLHYLYVNLGRRWCYWAMRAYFAMSRIKNEMFKEHP